MSDSTWDTVWRAISPLEPNAVSSSPTRSWTTSPEFREGMTGILAQRSGIPLRVSDLTHWLLVNLPWCGFEGELIALPSTVNEGIGLLRKWTARGHCAVLLAFDGPYTPQLEAQLADLRYERSATGIVDPVQPDPRIAEQTLVLSVQKDAITIELPGSEDGQPTERMSPVTTVPCSELVARYSHLLRLKRVAGTGRRTAQAEAAIQQWTLFAMACPSRLIRASIEDRERRERAGKFWRQLAGNGRTPVAKRLNRLATLLETATSPVDIQHGIDLLLELACRPLMLPPLVEEALRAPTNQILTDIERRELIYLARAGTRDLRILAAARLRSEREFPDVRSTLAQLAFDSDPWVRECVGR